MADIFSYEYKDFDGKSGKITLCSGPVIFNTKGEVLVHISKSTGKYQFIGGRLDDTKSLQENALLRSKEVLGHTDLELLDTPPLCILGEIIRDNMKEKVLLYHYKAQLRDEASIGKGEWKSLEAIKELQSSDMLSSPNVLIAAKHFS